MTRPLRQDTAPVLGILTTLTVSLLTTIALGAAPSRPDPVVVGLPPILPYSAEVEDPVLGVLVGLVQTGTYGTLTGSRLRARLDQMGKTSKIPLETITEFRRFPGDKKGTAVLSVEFAEPLDLPVPYSVLGYHPGSFRTSRHCTFHEWILGDVGLLHRSETDDNRYETMVLKLKNVHLYGVVSGEITLDVDGWLDRLMGSKLDDAEVTALMLCRYEGELLGLALGYTREHRGRFGPPHWRQSRR